MSIIKRLDPNTASRTLGVFLSPTSEWTKQIEVLKAKMDKLAGRLLTSSLSCDDVRVFYQSIYTPSIRYVLPALSIEEIQTRSIEVLPDGEWPGWFSSFGGSQSFYFVAYSDMDHAIAHVSLQSQHYYHSDGLLAFPSLLQARPVF